MQDGDPSAGSGATLKDVLRSTVALLRQSDTFKLITTEGAQRLSSRADERQRVANAAAMVQVPGLDDQEEFRAVLRLAQAEATVQQKLAEWLERIGAEGGGS